MRGNEGDVKFFSVSSLTATTSWVQTESPAQAPPAGPQGGHKRTPSEAERWLEEVSKAVMAPQPAPCLPPPPTQQPPPVPTLPGPPVPTLAGPTLPTLAGPPVPTMAGQPGSLPTSMQPFPLAFDATPAPVGMFGQPPLQPAFVPMQAYMPAMANSMTYPNASVPVVGITPSQMVANVFCTAAGSGGAASMGVNMGPKTGVMNVGLQPAFPSLPGGFPAVPITTVPVVNGLPHNPISVTSNGANHCHTGAASMSMAGGIGSVGNSNSSGGGWPMESAPAMSTNPPADSQEAERFEAKWAALESKTQPKTANPFSNDLQKTFEIEL